MTADKSQFIEVGTRAIAALENATARLEALNRRLEAQEHQRKPELRLIPGGNRQRTRQVGRPGRSGPPWRAARVLKGGTHSCSSKTPPLELGRVVVTAGCLERLRIGDEPDVLVMARDLRPLLRRHCSGDWGDIDPEDSGANEQALRDGSRLLSLYAVRGERVWIITDAATDACPACWAGIGSCEPDNGEWGNGMHFRTDLPQRRLSTTVMLPEDY